MKVAARFRGCRSMNAVLSAAALLLWGCGSGVHDAATTSGNAIAAAAGPQLGYFWNQADETLRPVLGIPGASQVGASVVPAHVYTMGGGSSVSQIGLLQESDGSLDWMVLPSGQPSHLNAQSAAGAQMRFSPLGQSAVLFAPGGSVVTLVTGLGASPAVASVASANPLLDAAVSDGGTLAVVSQGAAGGQVQVSSNAGALQTVATVGGDGGVAFSGANLLFADSAANTLSIVPLASSGWAATIVPTTGLLAKPLAVGAAPGGQWAVVSNSGDPSVVRIDLTGQNAPLRIACACTPTSAIALSGSATFRITEPGTGPLWAVEAAAATPRSFFIPALPVTKP